MAKEICISSTPHETRLAILEDDQLAEIYYERENEYTLAGSIYNGRVTRVLPGMQSAFVDVGLERDAFLYVTDFLELEDAEETDELEKAAATGGNKPPREVRHTNAPEANAQAVKGSSRGEDRGARPAQKPEQKQEARQERPAQSRPSQERSFTVEAIPEAGDPIAAIPESALIAEQAEYEKDESGPGAKRWRGRRRRRGGRGAAGPHEGQPETRETSEVYTEQEAEPEEAQEVEPSFPEPEPRFDPAQTVPVPFVLPGESLSKYGGVPAESASGAVPEAAAPVRPASSFKPSTLIESPIVWDGSGLLPGESLSKHRGRSSEPAVEVDPEPHGIFSDAPDFGAEAPDAIEEGAFVEEMAEPELESAHEPETIAASEVSDKETDEEDTEEFDLIEETVMAAPEPQAAEAAPAETVPAKTEDYTVETVIDEPSADETVASPVTRQDENTGEPAPEQPAAHLVSELEPEIDANASHNVDPAAPTGFRLFGFGGKRKADEDAAKPKPTAQVSSYAPGSGLIEEELIEEEEFEAPRHQHRAKGGDHDLDDFEEETLPTHLRTGDLGEMLQEAHLDHRIQLNFDGKDDEDEDEDEPSAEGQPSAGAQQPRDRSGRNRRGRGPQGAPGGPEQGPRNDPPLCSDLRPAHHQRPAEAGPGDSGSDRQGTHRQEGRAHHLAHRPAGPLPGLHAHGLAHWREPQDRIGR